MVVDDDFTGYVRARWKDLVSALEEDGIAPETARLAVAEVLLASRRSWARRVAHEQIDQVLWAEMRQRVGLSTAPGAVPPHATRSLDVVDPTEPWFERAGVRRAARTRRNVRRGVLSCAGVVIAATGWSWWASLPTPPPVREETNQLPVPWYAAGDLHLAEVVVELPDIEAFAPTGDDVVVRMASGQVRVVRADGDVDDPSISRAEVRDVLGAAASVTDVEVPLGPYDVVLQSVSTADGGSAHVIDSARRADDGGALRQSESGRRAVVICDADGACGAAKTVVAVSQIIRLG